MTDLVPDRLLELLRESTRLTELLAGKPDTALIIPNDPAVIEQDLSRHLEEHLFTRQSAAFERQIDCLSVHINRYCRAGRAHGNCREDHTISTGEHVFEVFSSFEIDTETLKCTVFLVEGFKRPLALDDAVRLRFRLAPEIHELCAGLHDRKVDEKSAKVQQFYGRVELQVQELDIDRPVFMDEMEEVVLQSLKDTYSPKDSDDAVQDRVLLDKIDSLERQHVGQSTDELLPPDCVQLLKSSTG